MIRSVTFTVFAAALLTGGCDSIDPLTREGVWHPNHANHADLLAMAARPADVRLGHGEPLADGELAARAVARLRLGIVKPLPQSGLAEITMQGTAPGPAIAAPTSGPLP